MRALDTLVDKEGTGLAQVKALLSAAARPVELLPCDAAAGEKTLVALQLETRSPLGALAHGSGGLLIDGGWLRLLGAGCDRLPRGLVEWNRLGEPGGRLPGALLVADDAVGGFFALNHGGLLGDAGDVCWLSPQSLEWESLNIGYDGFLAWAVGKDLDHFYAAWRWPGWEAEVKALSSGEALLFEPPAAVPGAAFGERKRAPQAVDEVFKTHSDTLPRLLRAPAAPR
jgi:Protein of unknown function DUF2625